MWSPTLKHLELRIDQQFISYHPLGEAFSSLQELQKLDINGSLSNFGAIADLPLLERLRFKSDWMITEGKMGSFAAHLDDVTQFPALKYIKVGYPQSEKHDKQLENICIRRGIELELRRWHENFIPSYLSW